MNATRGRLIATVGGLGVLVVLALLALNWQSIAAHGRFWRLFESIGRNEQGLPEYRHRQTGIVMVRVPGGTFLMGSTVLEREEATGIGVPLPRRRRRTPSGTLSHKPLLTRRSRRRWSGWRR
jgi:hypothetical protein